MNTRNEVLALELLNMFKTDLAVREELLVMGGLYDGYHPKMEKVHLENATRLEAIIHEIGWPTVDKVGSEAAYAAWLILQHAISKPTLQRMSYPIFVEMAKYNEIMPSEVAMLYDRICYFEMRPQKYGTQFDFDEHEVLNPWEIEDMEHVDEYRKSVGLPPLNETIKRMQDAAKKQNEKPTKPYQERLQDRLEWSKKVGWIE